MGQSINGSDNLCFGLSGPELFGSTGLDCLDMKPLVSGGAGHVLELFSPVRGGIKLLLNQLNALRTNYFIFHGSWRLVPTN